MVITHTTKESFLQLQASQLHQSQFTLKTTSDQILLHISLATTTKESTDLLRIASKLVKLGQSLSASRSILSNQENTATSQEKLSVNQESPAENRMITPTIKELSIQLLQTSSQQLREHISLATMIKQLRELFRTALKLVKLKKALSANRLIMSPQESTAVSQRKQSENQESPKETIVITPIMKESSMKQNQLFHRTTRNQLREHTSLATTIMK